MAKEIEKYRTRGSAQVEAQEDLGRTIDRVDSLAHALHIPMPPAFHVDQLKAVLPEIVAELRRHYITVTGDNPWSI